MINAQCEILVLNILVISKQFEIRIKYDKICIQDFHDIGSSVLGRVQSVPWHFKFLAYYEQDYC